MTDNEIIKNLKKVANADCNHCSFNNENCDGEDCDKYIAQKILDLINRQKAEIERLQNALTEERVTKINLGCNFAIASIKEFAERLKSRTHEISCNVLQVVTKADIDNLVKEMTEPSLLDKKFGGDKE